MALPVGCQAAPFSSHARRRARHDPAVHHVHGDEGREVQIGFFLVQIGHPGAFLNDDDDLGERGFNPTVGKVPLVLNEP